MATKTTLQRLSGIFRYLLISAATLIGIAIVIAAFTPEQQWVVMGNGQVTELWGTSDTTGRLSLLMIMAPLALSVGFGVYWLQRLFGEYHAGRFFGDGSMRCYVWLVWLKVFHFFYSAAWPLLINRLAQDQVPDDFNVTLEAGGLVELFVLLLIVHVLKEAQRIHDENEAFV